MADRPINLYQHEVRAVLAGRQTQFRRAIKPQPVPVGGPFYRPHPKSRPAEWHSVSADGTIANIQMLRVAPGDRLWVRETLECANGEAVGYPADKSWLPNTPWTWKRRSIPSIHMPRRLSRITLLLITLASTAAARGGFTQ